MSCKNRNSNGCGGCPRCKLNSYNWLDDIPGGVNDFELVEVHFKNTRKGFYRNSQHLPLEVGDVVAVEASPGHDIGTVAMTGRLVKLQMKRANLRRDAEIPRVFRKAKQSDLDTFEAAKSKEVDTMIRSRQIAADLKLNMKIGDVEYQGDGNKAIFYYIADDRVDFRQLIKVLAEAFKIRIEMKQIGARQEAGRIGGIGPCGRPLCCSSWMSGFVSVATSAARFQDISLNPQKLAGQCAKLKCCLNFEVDSYVEAVKRLPSHDVQLETKENVYYHFKTDIFKREVTYSTEKNSPANQVVISADRAFEVMALNKNGIKPDKLDIAENDHKQELKEYGDIIEQDSMTRFDKKKKRPKGVKRGGNQKLAGGEQKRGGKPNDAPKEGERPNASPDATRKQGRPDGAQGGGRQRNPGGNGQRNKRRRNDRSGNEPQGKENTQ